MEKVEIQVQPNSLKELVVGRKTFRSSIDFHVTEADLEKSRKELNETEEVRNDALRKLKEMLSGDDDITYRMDDVYLLRYLRFRKFNYKEAYKNLRNFYTTRNEYPDLYHLPPSLEPMLNSKIGTMMPYRDEKGQILLIVKLGNWKADEVNIRELLQMFNLICDIISMNPHIQINGITALYDLEGTSLSHVSQMVHPKLIRLWIKLTQELYPCRVKRIVCFNCNALQYACFATIRRFLKKKIADRVTLLRSDLSQVHEYIDPAILPKEYGGSLEDSECYSFLKHHMLGNLQYLEYEHSFIGLKKP